MSADLGDADRWLTLAAEATAAAQEVSDPEARRVLLFIADTYKRLAQRSLARKNHKS
jgi:hypothetical protein